MTMLVLVPLALAFAWLCRFGARRDIRRSNDETAPGVRPPARPIIVESVPIAVDDESGAWTALDDIQLNRLLKESSP